MPRLALLLPWLLLFLCLITAPSRPGVEGVAAANSIRPKNGSPHVGLKCAAGKKGARRKTCVNLGASGEAMPDGDARGSGRQPSGKGTGGKCISATARDPLVMMMRGEQHGMLLRQAPSEAAPIGRTMEMQDIIEWDFKSRSRPRRRSTKCLVQGCPLRATFGPKFGGRIPLRCIEHRVPNFDTCLCGIPICGYIGGCSTYAAYGSPGVVGPTLFCAAHKCERHINLAARICMAPSCSKIATFSDLETMGPALYCGTHRGREHRYTQRNRVMPYCQNPQCVKQPSFGSKYDGIRRYCREHSREDDVYLVSGRRICAADGCSLIPTFGDLKKGIAKFCVSHKAPQHVSVVQLLCKHVDCNRRAFYADEAGHPPRYCSKHKLPGNLHVYKQCQTAGCTNRAVYGRMLKSQPVTRHCAEHKEPSEGFLKSISTRVCLHPEGCTAQPSYGEKWSNTRLFCSRHKQKHHVNLLVQLCTFDGCDKISCYGNASDGIPRMCAKHRTKDYVDVRNKKCRDSRCNKQASYGNRVEGSRIYCKDHKQEQHIHINDQFGPKSRRNPATKGKRGKARKTSVAAEAQSTCDSSQGVNGTGQHGHRDDDVESLDEEEEVVGLGLGSGGETR